MIYIEKYQVKRGYDERQGKGYVYSIPRHVRVYPNGEVWEDQDDNPAMIGYAVWQTKECVGVSV